MLPWANLSQPLPPPSGISISSAVFAYNTAKIPSAFQWSGQPPKLPVPLGGSASHLIHISLGQPDSAPPPPRPKRQLIG